jgi:membrane protein DedA with SNARE-associated domain
VDDPSKPEPAEPSDPATPAISTGAFKGADSAGPNRLLLGLVLCTLVVLTAGNYISTAILFTLIKHHPAWLIGLNPTTRNLILVSNEMSAVSYFVLAVVRRMFPHPLWFLIGRWYGNAGIKWVEKRSPDIGAMVSTLERYFPRFGWLICIIYPHPLVCTMAGASAMSFLAFTVYTLLGVIGFVWLSRVFGDFLHPVTNSIANFGSHYWIPLTVLSVLVVIIGFFAGEKGGRSKIESIGQIEAELNADGHPQPPNNDMNSEQ